MVAIRAGRRDILTRKRNPVSYLALIDSEALVRPVVSPDAMRDQLEFLLEMGERPNITIRAVPSTTPGVHPGFAGSFNLLEFLRAQPVVHLEHYRASAFIWDDSHVTDYLEAVREIEVRAMTCEQTAQVIEQLVHELERG